MLIPPFRGLIQKTPNSLEILPLEYFTDIQAGERKAMDVIIRVNLLGRPNAPASSRVSVVVNCEHQSSSEPDFQRRLFFYFAQLHRKYLQPVYPIALFCDFWHNLAVSAKLCLTTTSTWLEKSQ
jgi:hypothetical protein